MTVENVIKEIIVICQKYGAHQVILFGSRAKGFARERSDIDIAVRGVKPFDDMSEEIQNIPTLLSIDLVNLDQCQNSYLLEDINEYGQEIYKKI